MTKEWPYKCWVCGKQADGSARAKIGFYPKYTYSLHVIAYCYEHLSEMTDFLEAVVKDWRRFIKDNREMIRTKIAEAEALRASEETREVGADRRGIDGNTKAYLCTVCHRECVDADAGYDTCPKCLKEEI